ncbi:hypothetical protein, partial [uncultured Dialister sp.]
MSEEDSVSIVPEEEVYRRIEEKVLSFPEVAAFTAEGFSYLMQGIGQAFGLKGHKGLLIRRNGKKGIEVAISLSLHSGCKVNQTAQRIQAAVKDVLASCTEEMIYG